MPETTRTMCFGTGQIIRIFDGRKIRCPDCTGYGHVNKPPRKQEPHVRRPRRRKPERPPAEILERQRQQAQTQSAQPSQPSEDCQPTPSTSPRTTKKRRTKRKRSKLSAKLRRYRAILTLTGVIALIIALKVIQHSV